MSQVVITNDKTEKLVFVAQKHIRIRQSGDPVNGLGDVMNVAEIGEFDLHNIFPPATETEAVNGVTDYQCVYIYNSHPSVTVKGIVMFSDNTTYSGDSIKFGLDPAGVGDGLTFGKAQMIANKSVTPTGVFFKDGRNRTDQNALVFPDIPPLKAIAVWHERRIQLKAQSVEDNKMRVVLDTSNIVGDYGIVSKPGTTTTAVTGQTDTTIDLSWLTNLISLEHFLDNLFFLGNTTQSNDSSQWIKNMGTFLLKDIMKMVFGWLDVMSMSKRNQLVNGVDPRAYAGYQSYNKKNVNYAILDTSGFQKYTNPSTQYNKIAEYLENANKNPNIDFIIAMMGTPPYASMPDNDPDLKIRIDTDLRKTYHDLFTKWGVHIVVSSGINNYQRQHVLGFNVNTPDSPNQLLTTQAPNYVISVGEKNFKVGSLYLNITSAVKKPLHNLPTIKPYTAFSYIPKGVAYLKFFTTQRTSLAEPILEGRYFDYYADPPVQGSVNPKKTVHLVDRFTVTFEKEEEEA